MRSVPAAAAQSTRLTFAAQTKPAGRFFVSAPQKSVRQRPLMAASFNAETVFWATSPLTSGGQTIPVPAGAPARLQIVAVLNATVLRVEPATLQLSANESRDVTVWADVPAGGTVLSPHIVVSAESPTDPAAANSAIIPVTLDPVF